MPSVSSSPIPVIRRSLPLPGTQPSPFTWVLGIQLRPLGFHSKPSYPTEPSPQPHSPLKVATNTSEYRSQFSPCSCSKHCRLPTGCVCFSYEFPINPFARFSTRKISAFTAHLHIGAVCSSSLTGLVYASSSSLPRVSELDHQAPSNVTSRLCVPLSSSMTPSLPCLQG